MAPKKATAGSTAEEDTRRDAIEGGAAPIFYDPNRPREYRKHKDSKSADLLPPQYMPELTSRLQWQKPKVTPFRFDGDTIPTPEASIEHLLAEGLISKLTPTAHTDALLTAQSHLRKGVRILSDTGCWVPPDGQLGNNLYRVVFNATFGYEVLDNLKSTKYHNLRDQPDAAYQEPPPPIEKSVAEDNDDKSFHYGGLISTSGGPGKAEMVKQATAAGTTREVFGLKLMCDLSHLCHNPFCCRPDHVCIELHGLNDRRKRCKGPRASGLCSCQEKYLERCRFDIDDGSKKLVHPCLVAPHLRGEWQRVVDGKLVTRFPEPELFMGGPWQANASPEALRLLTGKLLETGFKIEHFPFLFLDLTEADTIVQGLKGLAGSGPRQAADFRNVYFASYWQKGNARLCKLLSALSQLPEGPKSAKKTERALNRASQSGLLPETAPKSPKATAKAEAAEQAGAQAGPSATPRGRVEPTPEALPVVSPLSPGSRPGVPKKAAALGIGEFKRKSYGSGVETKKARK